MGLRVGLVQLKGWGLYSSRGGATSFLWVWLPGHCGAEYGGAMLDTRGFTGAMLNARQETGVMPNTQQETGVRGEEHYVTSRATMGNTLH
jgi:hypothetical protein